VNLASLTGLFAAAGCTKLFAKVLAENDNSKNQVYFGPDFEALNLFPTQGVVADSNPKKAIFKARLRFAWLREDGTAADAPGAQLILYPQYPEVRFSGFLKGARDAPSALMAPRLPGRVLFLGVTADNRVLGFVVAPDSMEAVQFRALAPAEPVGLFIPVDLPTVPGYVDSRGRLLEELRRVHRCGWIDSKQLAEDGTLAPCKAPQCGGFTLEAELGIPKNSRSEPDFFGWEVKQHAVPSFARIVSGTAITLMTPEPTGGIYKEAGVESFVRRFGYPDRRNRPDRLNFGGIHRANVRQSSTGLTLKIAGYNESTAKITDPAGCIALVSDSDEVAASWSFSGILAHWSRKHSRAVYVPSMRRKDPRWQYAYGGTVRLAMRTDPLRFLAALAAGAIYYDPGIKLEHQSGRPAVKRRSQFRVASRALDTLYERIESVAL
jgi:hypothetical protein